MRARTFARNADLEGLLTEINTALGPANQELRTSASEQFAKVFVVGPHRSGSTLLMQWLADTGLVAYPTNLLSRFYGAPLIGAKIQLLLTDPRYNFRDEILNFSSTLDFLSENGKTKGALAPNEFWYFWRRFLPYTDLDYLPNNELIARADLDGLQCELNALANTFERPFAMKGMIMNQNLDVLDSLFDRRLFIWLERDPAFNIQSALEARQRQYGDLSTWYSFKIKEYPELVDLDPLMSVAGQIHAINRSVSDAVDRMDPERVVHVRYEEFCAEPERFFDTIALRLEHIEGRPYRGQPYRGPSSFESTDRWRLDDYAYEDAIAAYRAIG